MNGLRLYWRYIKVSIRSQMQYRASFIMLSIGHFLSSGIEFIALWALFDSFGALQGWSLAEVALFYGLVNTAFALAEAGARGFDTFSRMVRSGDFDRILLRPRATALQIAGIEFQLLRVGRLAQGMIVVVLAAAMLNVSWTFWRVLAVAAAILGGAFMFAGLFVLQATMCFWTIESIEIMNTMTYGGVETAKYPLTVYRRWFRQFFTFFVPLAAVTYYPALIILGRPDSLGSPVWFQAVAPAIGVAFFAVALQVWRIGVRHYHSTGS